MGIFTIYPRHLRFAIKLARWCWRFRRLPFSTGNAALGGAHRGHCHRRSGVRRRGRTYSGAIRYRGMLRIVGTFIGCIAALAIIILMIRAPLLMMLVLSVGGFLHLDLLAGSRRKLLRLGAGRLYRADHYYHHSYRSDAGAAVCR
jgi:hypothetical protein